jgi:hypothetical protein
MIAGFYISLIVIVAHTRLWILDLSSADHQPMGLALGEIRNSQLFAPYYFALSPLPIALSSPDR